MKNYKAFTITELLVGLVIVSILILTVGVMLTIGNTGLTRATRTQDLYNDLGYGFKMMRKIVRESDNIVLNTAPSDPPWKSNVLQVAHEQNIGGVVTYKTAAFGVHQESGSSTKAFVYMPDITAASEYDKILDMRTSDTLNLTVAGTVADSFIARIAGEKNGISFNISNVIMRRNP